MLDFICIFASELSSSFFFSLVAFEFQGYQPSKMVSSPPSSQTVNGYPRFASLIETRPECAIFRRFGALNAQNLLYLQAELIGLEKSLREQQKEDSESGHQYKTKYAQNWFWLSTSERDGDTQQLDLVLKTRETLRQYSKSTVEHSPALSLL